MIPPYYGVIAMLARSIWATGQDQCATIKRVLAVMLPGVSVFLDVRPNTCICRLCHMFCFCVSSVLGIVAQLAALG